MVPTLKKILDAEEASFARALNRGETLFAKHAEATKMSGSTILDGKVVWQMYDTYGFPVDLTVSMAEELDLKVDMMEVEIARMESLELSKKGKFKGAVGNQ